MAGAPALENVASSYSKGGSGAATGNAAADITSSERRLLLRRRCALAPCCRRKGRRGRADPKTWDRGPSRRDASACLGTGGGVPERQTKIVARRPAWSRRHG